MAAALKVQVKKLAYYFFALFVFFTVFLAFFTVFFFAGMGRSPPKTGVIN
ncbi:MAG: hypothetical protein WC243_02095 [Patescibacteria group bacterium]|jgi:hypothetical protein